MKSLDLSAVTAGREALAAAEDRLRAMRERLEASRALVDTRQAEQRAAEEARRQAVIAGDDDEPAIRALVNSRILSEDAREKVAMLADAVTAAEDDVLAAEADLLAALDVARTEQYERTKAELVAAVLRFGPPFSAAAQAMGQAWGHTGQLLGDIGQRFVAPHWKAVDPIPELAQGHKSALLTEDRRAAG